MMKIIHLQCFPSCHEGRIRQTLPGEQVLKSRATDALSRKHDLLKCET